MSELEPTTQAFIDSLVGATPIFTLSPEAARNSAFDPKRTLPSLGQRERK